MCISPIFFFFFAPWQSQTSSSDCLAGTQQWKCYLFTLVARAKLNIWTIYSHITLCSLNCTDKRLPAVCINKEALTIMHIKVIFVTAIFLFSWFCLSGRPAGIKSETQTNEVLVQPNIFLPEISVFISSLQDPPQHSPISQRLQSWLIQIILTASEPLPSLIKSLAN